MCLESGISSLQSGFWSWQSGLCSLESAVWNLQSEFAVWSLEFAVWSLQFGVCSLESAVWSVEFAVSSLDSGALIESCSLSPAHSQSKHAKNRKVPSDHRFKRHLEIKITPNNSWADQPPADNRFKCHLEMKMNVAKKAWRTGRQRNHRYNDISSNEKSKMGGPAAGGETTPCDYMKADRPPAETPL